ncbi:MAG: hypothetical protein LAQ69_35700, partial [Acidobacteriia bacterium]|nr:hypothetical protein [Terriglobia bacterium]
MTESTARAALFELQSSTSPFYAWEVPQKPVCVRIPFSVIDRLEHEAVESFRSLTSRGSEIGGVLFGSVSPVEPISVTIQDYELISCDYSRGPLYRLADADMARFDRSILQQGTASPLTVVGMFRSHTRKGLALDSDDLAFFESRFRDPHHIVLLVRPFASKVSSAGIFIREGRLVNGEASYLEFPFRSSQLTPGKLPAEAMEPGPPAAALGSTLPAPQAPRTAVRGQIVPIAPRRETAPTAPVAATEPAVSAPAASVKTGAPTAPQPGDSPKPAAKVEEKAAAPKVEERVVKPKVEEKA